MRSFDLSPLYRSTVGFDRLASLMDGMERSGGNTYPPYNIVKLDEDSYRVTIAAAGFAESELTIEARGAELVVTGAKSTEAKQADASRQFLHRGVAERAFERRFHLADHVRAVGASLENGLLHIDLRREIPEALKPRQIAIARADAGAPAIEAAPTRDDEPSTLQ